MSQYPNNERGVRHGAPIGNGTYGESPASGPAPTTAGHHKHDILNKVDPRVDSTQDRRPVQQNNVPAGTYGPHSSRLANALDPRVDSDMDGRGRNQAGMTGAGMTGASMAGGVGHNANANVPEGTYGPHNSRVANALDPRVDSDRDRHGAAPGGSYQGGAGSGYPHNGTTGYGQTTAGGGYGQPVGGGLGHSHQQQGYGAGAGTMSGAVPNAAMSGPGPAPNTAGPHKSDLMNKLDPRVDSKTGAMKESGSEYSERRGI